MDGAPDRPAGAPLRSLACLVAIQVTGSDLGGETLWPVGFNPDEPPDDDDDEINEILSSLDDGTKSLYDDLENNVRSLVEYDIPDELDVSDLPNYMSEPIEEMVEAARGLAGVTIEHSGGADLDIRFTMDYRASAFGAIAWRKASSDVRRLVRVARAFHGAREDGQGTAARWRDRMLLRNDQGELDRLERRVLHEDIAVERLLENAAVARPDDVEIRDVRNQWSALGKRRASEWLSAEKDGDTTNDVPTDLEVKRLKVVGDVLNSVSAEERHEVFEQLRAELATQ